MLEVYQAFGDYHDMMDLTEALIARVAQEALGHHRRSTYDGRDDRPEPPWRRAPMADADRASTPASRCTRSMPIERAARRSPTARRRSGSTSGAPGKLMAERLRGDGCEAKLVEPTFVIDHPREVSPLARAHRDDPTLTERFELVVAGRELANGFSELNDPVDQRARFEPSRRSQGRPATTRPMPSTTTTSRALEYGLPPTGGFGIGIDRLVMLLTDVDIIRDVILFPTLRPEERRGEARAAGEARSRPRQPAKPMPPPPADPDADPLAPRARSNAPASSPG